jgi:peptidoglycan/LPS O-acetylase OafA/YrhL
LATASAQRKNINFDILDSLRGLASLYVCIAHCRANLWIGGQKYLELHPFNTWGFTDWIIMTSMSLTKLSGEAVIFFFVLSGFSIAHSLRSQPSAKLFLFKRFIRLYPPYVLGFLLALLSIVLLKSNYDLYLSGKYTTDSFILFKNSLVLFDVSSIVNTLLYQPVLGTVITPYWSLVYEVIFYFSAIFFLRKLQWYYLASALFFVIGILAEFFLPELQGKSVFLAFILQYNFYFMIGVYAYNNLEKLISFTFLESKLLIPGLVASYFAMVGLESTIGEKHNVSFLVAAICCVTMMVLFLKRNIHIKPLQRIGKFSYTLYVVHFSVITIIIWFLFSVVKLTPPYLNNFLIWMPAVLVCVGVSYLAYLLVEKPTQKLLNRLRKQ